MFFRINPLKGRNGAKGMSHPNESSKNFEFEFEFESEFKFEASGGEPIESLDSDFHIDGTVLTHIAKPNTNTWVLIDLNWP